MKSRHIDLHHREGRGCDACGEATKRALWAFAEWLAAAAALFMLFKAMGVL